MLQLAVPDLVSVVQVCRAWRQVGQPLLHRTMTYPIARSCSTCRSCSLRDMVEVQRLRLIHALLQPAKAISLRHLTITGADPVCECGERDVTSLRSVDFRRLCLNTLLAVVSRAENLRSLRFDV